MLTEKEGEGIKEICCGGYFLAEGLGKSLTILLQRRVRRTSTGWSVPRSREVWDCASPASSLLSLSLFKSPLTILLQRREEKILPRLTPSHHSLASTLRVVPNNGDAALPAPLAPTLLTPPFLLVSTSKSIRQDA